MDDNLPSSSTGRVQVSAPLRPEEVRTLLDGALQSGKVIAGARRGVFEMRRADCENFYHLISQRVRDQNSCSLEKFEISVFHSNGTSIKLAGISEFSRYAETRKVTPTVVSFHWTYLLKFPETSIPGETGDRYYDCFVRRSSYSDGHSNIRE